jgi:endosialidase-like protein
MGFNFPDAPAANELYPPTAVAGQPQYQWNGYAWVPVSGGSGGGTTLLVQDTPPTAVPDSSLWWESDSGRLHVRYNDGDSTAWVQAAASTQQVVDVSSVVQKTGDSMSGNLTISKVTPALVLNDSGTGTAVIQGYKGSYPRWNVAVADASVEGGNNTGSDFVISRFSDAGVALDNPLRISRATGGISFTGEALTYSAAQPWLMVNKTVSSGAHNMIAGQTFNKGRWAFSLGDNTAEAAGNVGSEFRLYRYDNNGSLIGNPFSITRSNGNVYFEGNEYTLGNANGTPRITMHNGPGMGAILMGGFGANARWGVFLGEGTAETGGNTGSHFGVYKYTDAGAQAGHCIHANRQTGLVTFQYGMISYLAGCFGVGALPGLNSCIKVAHGGGPTQYGIGLQPSVDNTVAIYFASATGAGIGSISTTTVGTSYATTSSGELKEDLKSFDAGSIIDATEVYDFAWKSTGERSFGVIAQQAIEVYPLAVTHIEGVPLAPEAKEGEIGEEFWGVDYSKYVPVLLQELKALRVRVAELEGRIASKPGA